MMVRIPHVMMGAIAILLASGSSGGDLIAATAMFQEDVTEGGAYQAIAVDLRSKSTEADRNREKSSSGGDVTAWWAGRIGTDDAVRGLAGFDISAIPAGSVITSVTLTVTPRGPDANSQDQDYTVSLHELDGTIIEGTGTFDDNPTPTGPSWNSRDVNGPVAWTTAGGDFSATVLSSIVDNPHTLVQDEKIVFPSSSDFVSAAQGALDGSGTLYFLMKSSSEDTSSSDRAFFNFYSDDDTTDATRAPKLTIEYVPEPSSLVLLSLGAMALIGLRRR